MLLQEKAALEEQCAQLRLQAQAGAGAAAASESETPGPNLAAMLEQRTAELHVAEERSRDAAAEIETLLAAVAKHREEVGHICFSAFGHFMPKPK